MPFINTNAPMEKSLRERLKLLPSKKKVTVNTKESNTSPKLLVFFARSLVRAVTSCKKIINDRCGPNDHVQRFSIRMTPGPHARIARRKRRVSQVKRDPLGIKKLISCQIAPEVLQKTFSACESFNGVSYELFQTRNHGRMKSSILLAISGETSRRGAR